MSEKATLLTSIPPVGKSDSGEKPDLTSSGSESVGGGSNVKQLSEMAISGAREVADGSAAGDSASISSFQGIIYGSFVLTFCLAGFAAVILFRKASKAAEDRFVLGSRALASLCGLFSIYGFFVTYLFANYLNGNTDQAPVLPSIAIWVIAGPIIGLILNELLTLTKKPEKSAIVFDGIAYALIFGLAAFSTTPGIKANAALIFSLASGFIFIVPVARMFSLFRTAKAKHPELCDRSDQVLIYSLIILPGLIPVIAFAHVCGMGKDGGDITQFLLNFVAFDFILIAALAMIASADEFDPHLEKEKGAGKSDTVDSKPTSKKDKKAVTQASKPKPEADSVAPSKLAPKKLPPHPTVKTSTESPLPSALKRPSVSQVSGKPAPNAPSRLKAPSKPKKRF